MSGSSEERHRQFKVITSHRANNSLITHHIVLVSVANGPWSGTGPRPRVWQSLSYFILHLIKKLINIKVNGLNRLFGWRQVESHPVRSGLVGQGWFTNQAKTAAALLGPQKPEVHSMSAGSLNVNLFDDWHSIRRLSTNAVSALLVCDPVLPLRTIQFSCLARARQQFLCPGGPNTVDTYLSYKASLF